MDCKVLTHFLASTPKGADFLILIATLPVQLGLYARLFLFNVDTTAIRYFSSLGERISHRNRNYLVNTDSFLFFIICEFSLVHLQLKF